MPSRASACAISTPMAPRPMTAMRGGSVSRSNSVSVVSSLSPSACQAGGTTGLEPVARTMARAEISWPFTARRPGPSRRARPLTARSPRLSVACRVPLTKPSRSRRTRRSTAGRSTESASPPRMPNSFEGVAPVVGVGGLDQHFRGHAADAGAGGAPGAVVDQQEILRALPHLAQRGETGAAGADDDHFVVCVHGVFSSCLQACLHLNPVG
jgi:hypothetical protein